MIKFDDYKDCLLNDETVLKSQQRFKSKRHDVYTENINKIALKLQIKLQVILMDIKANKRWSNNKIINKYPG